jgi:hypothetical protein
MKNSNALDNLRAALMDAVISAPATGERYIEINSRLRLWVLDVARSVNDIYLAVNEHDMNLEGNVIPTAIDVGQDILISGVSHGGLERLKGQIGSITEIFHAAIEAEGVTDYSPVFSASRAATQAVHSALPIVSDHDIFSVVTRGLAVVEQCVLANAYLNLSADFDGTVAPTNKQVAGAIAEARAEMIPLYQEGLVSRLKANVPGDFQRTTVSAPAI